MTASHANKPAGCRLRAGGLRFMQLFRGGCDALWCDAAAAAAL